MIENICLNIIIYMYTYMYIYTLYISVCATIFLSLPEDLYKFNFCVFFSIIFLGFFSPVARMAVSVITKKFS